MDQFSLIYPLRFFPGPEVFRLTKSRLLHKHFNTAGLKDLIHKLGTEIIVLSFYGLVAHTAYDPKIVVMIFFLIILKLLQFMQNILILFLCDPEPFYQTFCAYVPAKYSLCDILLNEAAAERIVQFLSGKTVHFVQIDIQC